MSVDDIPDPWYADDKGFGAIHYAAKNANIRILTLLLQYDPTLKSMRTENTEKLGLLHMAVLADNKALSRLLVNEHKINLLQVDG